MIKKYLEERKELLNNIIRQNKEKYDHNQIAIAESHNQIKELDSMVDEATQIFSVKAREDNGYKNQEISDLEKKIAAYIIENKEYEKNINAAKTELSVVEKCINQVKENINTEKSIQINNDNVSRETYEKEYSGGIQLNIDDIIKNKNGDIKKNELISKLEFCESIAEIDGKRVAIELNNIIKSINE